MRARGDAHDSQSSSEVDDNLALRGGPLKEVPDSHVDDVKPEMVSAVDQGGPSLELLDKEAKKVRLVGIVDALYASLGDDAAAVCLRGKPGVSVFPLSPESLQLSSSQKGPTASEWPLTDMTKSSCARSLRDRPSGFFLAMAGLSGHQMELGEGSKCGTQK